MSITGHYYTVTYSNGRVGIRYRPVERTVSPESAAHRERQSLHRAPVAGRVERTDRGAIRTRSRRALASTITPEPVSA